jgi:hypothetical protein
VKVTVKNLGILKKAEFDVGDLTIICGTNNTWKTYATYALYGFIDYWKEEFAYDWLGPEATEKLFNSSSVVVELDGIRRNIRNIVAGACKKYVRTLPTVFAAPADRFSDSDFKVSVSETEVDFIGIERTIQSTRGQGEKPIFGIYKKRGENTITVNIPSKMEKTGKTSNWQFLAQEINHAIKMLLFGDIFPAVFIASIERTGAAIFQKELDFTRNRLLERVINKDADISPFTLLDTVYKNGYALPVNRNVDFNRSLSEVAKFESVISKENPDILSSFESMLGGEYRSTKDSVYYIPEKTKVKLTMAESASSVRSLLNIGFYIKHIARPGDILMIDEPELNLHPSNQRSMARILSRLVNAGVKVFITTHSDYILKEFNTLIMLKNRNSIAARVMNKYGYHERELLDTGKIKAYIARKELIEVDGAARRQKCNTFVPAPIDESGIEISEFDDTINEMNRIQEELLFGEPAV